MKLKLNLLKKTLREKIDLFVINFFSRAIKPFSQTFRRVFESKKIRHIYGVLVVLSILLIAIIPIVISFLQTKIDTNNTNVEIAYMEIVTTKQSIRLPIDSFTISQGFQLFHPGIDMAAIKGSPVYPIMGGTVVYINYGRFGYGNHVLVDHGSGLTSLYAHFSKIEAKVGEKVTQESILGLVGSTGWSTGPHLHLQIGEQGRWINPRAFFESYFGKKLASTR